MRPLEVPPDLSSPNPNDRYAVPDTNSATLSDLKQGQPAGAGTPVILPQPDKAYIERSGSQRWLVVDAPPEKVWPVVKEFWQETGFIVVSENQETGIMETDWAENRAKIPQGWVRNVLGKVMDQAYSSPERDKYRARLERGQKAGTTEIFVSHRGMYEMYVNDANMRQTGRTVWQPACRRSRAGGGDAAPRLQAKFAGDAGGRKRTVQGDQAAASAPCSGNQGTQRHARSSLLTDDYDRAWRRVGLSLDRLGFTVQDRDRAGGLYYVRYLNPEGEAKKPGMLSCLAFWESDAPKGKAEDYRIVVADAKPGAEVRVLGADGKPDTSEAATRILTVLQEDLK